MSRGIVSTGDIGSEKPVATAEPAVAETPDAASHCGDAPRHGRRHGHGWLMVVCCAAPLVLLGGARLAGLPFTGGLAAVAMLACPAMHFLMMRGMHEGHDDGGAAAKDEPRRE